MDDATTPATEPDGWRPLPRPRGVVRLADGLLLRQGPDWSREGGRLISTPIGDGRSSLWQGGGFAVLVNHFREPRTGRPILHVQVSTSQLPGGPRDLTWEEHKRFRDAFFPEDVDVLIVLPQWANYVNVEPWSWHLWQAPEPWGIGGDGVDRGGSS